MGLLGAPRMQVFPLVCARCAEPMRIIAFVTDIGSIQPILAYLGEPTQAPCIALASRPRSSLGGGLDPSAGIHLSEPLPEHEFDQRVSGQAPPLRTVLPIKAP